MSGQPDGWLDHQNAKLIKGIPYLRSLLSTKFPSFFVDALMDSDFICNRVGLQATIKFLRSCLYKGSKFHIFSGAINTHLYNEHMTQWFAYKQANSWNHHLTFHGYNVYSHGFYQNNRQTALNALYALQYHAYNPKMYDLVDMHLPVDGVVDIVTQYCATPHITQILQSCHHALMSLRHWYVLPPDKPCPRRQKRICDLCPSGVAVCGVRKIGALHLCLWHRRQNYMR